MREKLIELLTGFSIDTAADVEYVVDHLLAHGVTIDDGELEFDYEAEM